MKRLLSILLLLIVPVILHAQNSVHGTVVDQQTGTPIPGASAVVTGTTTGAVTNDVGAFTLTSDAAITSITVTRTGYAATEVAVTDASASLRIRLTPTTTTLAGVQVVAHS